MKTTQFLLLMLATAMFLSCKDSSQKSDTESNNDRLEKLAKGEIEFLEFNEPTFRSFASTKVVKGKVKDISVGYKPKVHMQNGETFFLRYSEEIGKTMLHEMCSYFQDPYIEAYFHEDNSNECFYYILYGLNERKNAIKFYKENTKKSLGKSSLDMKSYQHNRYIGKIKKSGKAEVGAITIFICNYKIAEMSYLSDGSILTMDAQLRHSVLKKNPLAAGDVIDYVISDSEGLNWLHNVYDYKYID
ncbi:MAG: hypothetical protein PHE89_02425 [Alphaproteobacteria bacterium]|nr:hypothetical protein [Alphaproteobacteria bacterium]